MELTSSNVSSFIQQHQETLVTWGVFFIIMIVALVLGGASLRRYLAERRLNKKIRSLGKAHMHHVAIPDGVDGYVFVEHLVLNDKGIFALSLCHYHGNVFAAENIDTWTQVVGNRSYKFPNPLQQLERDITAIKHHLKNTQIEGRILYHKGAAFPKGCPDSVMSVEQMVDAYASSGTPSPLLQQDWQILQSVAAKPESQNLSQQVIQQDENGWQARDILALLSIVIGVAWLAGRYTL